MTDSVRRSGRVRQQNRKYAIDPADDPESDELRSPRSDVDASSFEHDTDKNEENTYMDEDSVLENEDSSAEEDDENGSEEDFSGSEGIPIGSSSKITTKRLLGRKSKKNSDLRYRVGYQADGSRTRGFLFHPSVRNKDVTINEIAGEEQFFIEKIRAEKNKYIGVLTVPFRKSTIPGRIGLCYPEVYDDTIRDVEKRTHLSWYKGKKGWQTMAQVQSTKRCDLHSRNLYVNTELPPQHLFLGPYDAQHRFTVGLADIISISEAWRTTISASENHEDYDENSSDRSAWIINLGSRVLAIDWAPNQNADYQYLAVSVAKVRPTSVPHVSSFESMEPYEAGIQIWAFAVTSNDNITLMDMSKKPKLVHIICAKWGTIRRLSWCPAAVPVAHSSKSIGLLAVISTDGFIRVIDVCTDDETANPYVNYEAAAFVSKPPDTVCTCLTWLSASQLAAGCANGYVAIWDVGDHITTDKTTAMNSSIAVPKWYHALHTTYIISIIAHQPYPCQHITTNAVEGRVRVTSIHNPYADTVHGPRERHFTPPLSVAPHILGFYEIDESDSLRARSLRHIPISRAIGRAAAQITCMDAGKTHPCLLVGSADGSVFVTNPLRRIFIRRMLRDKVVAWQQAWFKHEFVPSTRLSQSTDYTTMLHRDSEKHFHIYPRKGDSRFLESFTIEKISMARGTQQSKDNDPIEADIEEDLPVPEDHPPATFDKQEQVIEDVLISIFEEEQAVTCLSWNPNISTGGWAAAGMANGLLRVEDLAI